MRIEMDMNGSEVGVFEPLPAGDYILTCTKVEDGKQNPGKNPYIRLELTVAEGQYTNRKIWHNLVLLPLGHEFHGMTVHAFKAFGLPHDGHVSFSSSEFVGRGCKARIIIEEKTNDGKTYINNRVKRFMYEEAEVVLEKEEVF